MPLCVRRKFWKSLLVKLMESPGATVYLMSSRTMLMTTEPV